MNNTGKVVWFFALTVCGLARVVAADEAQMRSFIQKHCVECHDADVRKGDLDLTSLSANFSDAELFARWLKVHDRIESGEMPPKKKARPAANQAGAVTKWLGDSLSAAERARLGAERTAVRRLTRGEYEKGVPNFPGVGIER